MGRGNLCPELQALLQRKLASGNRIAEPPQRTDGPHAGSVFVSLKRDLRSGVASLPATVQHAICTDPHNGWHDECDCTTRQHLLVAGASKPPRACVRCSHVAAAASVTCHAPVKRQNPASLRGSA